MNRTLNFTNGPEAEFKKFEPRLKNGWFHLKLYLNFQDLSWRSIENRFFEDLRRGLNTLNLDTGHLKLRLESL